MQGNSLSNKLISFIIIGRNEGWKLTHCLESIFKSAINNLLSYYEVIYVDSQSTDDSIVRASKFANIRIFLITGKYNAAIGRNIGAKEAKGDFLFFLDGDMELHPEFIKEALRLHKKDLRFISGQIEEQFYNENWEPIGKKLVFPQKKLNTFNLTNGGAFIIEKSLWQSVNGMRTKYQYSQDIDLNYRLIRKGYQIYRSDKIYVKHHTIQYNYKTSFKRELFKFRKYLYKGLLIRDHLFNLRILKRNLRINYSLYMLIISSFFSLLFSNMGFSIPYFSIVFIRSFSQYKRFKHVAMRGYFTFLLKYIYQDITGIIGLLFFYPKNITVAYKIIK